MLSFRSRLEALKKEHDRLLRRENRPVTPGNGVVSRYAYPVLTAMHTPLFWRYDLSPLSNPFLLERFGISGVFNAGAIKIDGRYLLVARVEAADRKSFFAVAESPTGTDQFVFWDRPMDMPPAAGGDANIYDMRVIQHEDGWIYGIFCTEQRDCAATDSNQAAAIAQCAIARTKDLKVWHRLPDLQTRSPQQRNVVLHPEFVNGQYAFYTRPQDGFIEAGNGGGIRFGLCDDIEAAVIYEEVVIDPKKYHTNYEAKNGLGPAPIKTNLGWLHLAHGVRNTAAGLRYTLYVFMTALDDLTRVIYKPAGYFLAPEGEERVGNVSNVLFCNGWIADDDGTVFIYYASSDTRMHVATTSIPKLLDYLVNTAPDGFRSAISVKTLNAIIDKNLSAPDIRTSLSEVRLRTRT